MATFDGSIGLVDVIVGHPRPMGDAFDALLTSSSGRSVIGYRYLRVMANQDFYYLPWTATVNNYTRGIDFARKLAAAKRQSLTFVVPNKNHLDERLKRDRVVTPRSGGASSSDFVALLHPDVKALSRFFNDRQEGGFLVVEIAAYPMAGWAAVHGATDVSTHEIVPDDRPVEVKRIHEHILDVGYNGWTSPPGSFSIRNDLQELCDSGWLNERGKDYLVASMAAERSWESLRELRRLADRVNPRPSMVR
jgi:hypothetical protein